MLHPWIGNFLSPPLFFFRITTNDTIDIFLSPLIVLASPHKDMTAVHTARGFTTSLESLFIIAHEQVRSSCVQPPDPINAKTVHGPATCSISPWLRHHCALRYCITPKWTSAFLATTKYALGKIHPFALPKSPISNPNDYSEHYWSKCRSRTWRRHAGVQASTRRQLRLTHFCRNSQVTTHPSELSISL
jgi:hypothetical protein